MAQIIIESIPDDLPNYFFSNSNGIDIFDTLEFFLNIIDEA